MFSNQIVPQSYEFSDHSRTLKVEEQLPALKQYLQWLNAELNWLDIPANKERLEQCYYGMSSYLLTDRPVKIEKFSKYGLKDFQDTPVEKLYSKMLDELNTKGALFVVVHDLAEIGVPKDLPNSFLANTPELVFLAACYEVLSTKHTTEYMKNLINTYLAKRKKPSKQINNEERSEAYFVWLEQCKNMRKQRQEKLLEIARLRLKIKELQAEHDNMKIGSF